MLRFSSFVLFCNVLLFGETGSFAFSMQQLKHGRSASIWSTKVQNPAPTRSSALKKKPSENGTKLYLSDNNKKSSPKLDENVSSKLVSESIAPWRSLRLFLYFAFGSGALLGGFINLSGAISAAGREGVDMNVEYTNLAIDFGAVALFAFLAKFDLDKQAELEQGIQERVAKKKQQQIIAKGMREREKILGTLELNIQVSTSGETRQATIKESQEGAKQHIILVAGPKKACRDALIGANLLKMGNFAMRNILVVPYETDMVDPGTKPGSGAGFGERPLYETQPYVARPVGDGWEEYVQAEIRDAVDQNGVKAEDEGIAIVIANSGKVIRRGIGKVPWRQMVEELEAQVKA